MDAYLAIISKREVRDYSDAPISDDQLTRILQAGRATGSSQNRQRWRFVLVTDRDALTSLSELVSRPSNLLTCQAAIAVVLTEGARAFDAGRVSQNLMLAAWSLGIGTCPNTCRDQDRGRQLLGLEATDTIATMLSLGYPKRPYHPERSEPEQILQRIDRRPLDELVNRI